jgi:protein gp37
MREEWVRDIRDQCAGSGVPFFFKQWGGVFKSRTGRQLEGRTWDEMPAGGERTRHWPLRPIERHA